VNSIGHINAQYILDHARCRLRHAIHPFTPYLTWEIVRFLAAQIDRNHRGLEAGSGASTIWFARRCRQLISIEHDPDWANRVQGWLVRRGLSDHVDLRLFARTPDGTPQEYVTAIESERDVSFDFVLIDGKRRDVCALAAVPKLKCGGLLIVDDAQRYIPRETPSRAPFARQYKDGFASRKWEEFTVSIRDWPILWSTDGIRDTVVYRRP
jgi:predicted O-methyltransferase YrrM